MATVGDTYLGIADVLKRQDPDGNVADIIELLAEKNEILQDMMVQEANDGTSHLTTVRTGIPAGAWYTMYRGVQPVKTRTAQVRDTTGTQMQFSEVNAELLRLSKNPMKVRMSEDSGIIEGMGQTMADTLFYGNTDTDPEEFLGLAPRYGDLSAENGDNILVGGGAGSDNTSIWLVCWGDNTVHGIYPEGTQAGIEMKDHGEGIKEYSDGSLEVVFRSQYIWRLGLSLRDWRFVVRIANIDVSDLTADASAGADLVDLMVQALEIMESMDAGRCAFYCNRTVKSFLRRQELNVSNLRYGLDEVAGKHVLMFDGIPVRRTDAILNTEATVS